MQNDWLNIDLKNMVSSLRENVRAFGGFNPEQVRKAAFTTEETLRAGILTALVSEAKTGLQIIDDIEASTTSTFRPSAGTIYPLLEIMIDEGLLSSAFKKDRKLFSLTSTGKTAQAELPIVAATESESAENIWATPKWVDLRGVVPVAASRLARVSIEVAKFGSKEQQEAAAAAIDEARRRIHEILASDK